MLKVAAVIIPLLASSLVSFAQQALTPPDAFTRFESVKPGQGVVKITQDVNIRNLVNLHASQLRKMNGIKGYRICIYLGSGQEANKKADQERAKFISLYEDAKSYKRFEYPYFKVYVGDFRTKSEALKFLKKIEGNYSDEAFIREDIISFPD
jgi:hypothetical protein